MNDKFFIDSNVLLYLFDTSDLRKEAIAFDLLQRKGIISPQVLFECLNVCIKKFKRSKEQALASAQYLFETALLQSETNEVVEKAFTVFRRHLLQPYDSKIVASALIAGCTTLYSEDMQHGLVIENTLTIVNPFL